MSDRRRLSLISGRSRLSPSLVAASWTHSHPASTRSQAPGRTMLPTRSEETEQGEPRYWAPPGRRGWARPLHAGPVLPAEDRQTEHGAGGAHVMPTLTQNGGAHDQPGTAPGSHTVINLAQTAGPLSPGEAVSRARSPFLCHRAGVERLHVRIVFADSLSSGKSPQRRISVSLSMK